MSFQVMVRDLRYWESCIRDRLPLNLNNQCSSNSKYISKIISLSEKALTKFNLTSEDISYISDSVSYLLRTDLVKTNTFLYHQLFLPEKRLPVFFGEDGLELRLLNDPKTITPGFNLRQTPFYDLVNSAAEWFRCYLATISEGKFTEKLTTDHNSFTPSYILADVTAFLVDPTQLIDYTYSNEEIINFNKELIDDFNNI